MCTYQTLDVSPRGVWRVRVVHPRKAQTRLYVVDDFGNLVRRDTVAVCEVN